MVKIRLATRRLELVPVEVSDRDWLHLALDLTRVRRYPWDDEAVPMDGVIEEIETSDALRHGRLGHVAAPCRRLAA